MIENMELRFENHTLGGQREAVVRALRLAYNDMRVEGDAVLRG